MRRWRGPALLIAVGGGMAIWATLRIATLDEPEPIDPSLWRQATCTIDQVNARFPEASYISKSGRSRDNGQFSVRARYRYLVDGRETKGDGFCTVEGLCKSADDIRAARALRPGGTTRCWVSRNDPARSALRLATSGQVESARTRPRDPDPGNLV